MVVCWCGTSDHGRLSSGRSEDSWDVSTVCRPRSDEELHHAVQYCSSVDHSENEPGPRRVDLPVSTVRL